MNNDNPHLWNEFLLGNFGAYKKMYDDNIDNLFRFGMQFTDDRELIKDCIQDIFIALYNKSAGLGPDCNYRAYLFSSLRNSILNNLKKNANLKKYYHNLHFDIIGDTSPEENVIVTEEDRIIKNRLDSVLSYLTLRQREVVFYRFIEGMTIDEIAFIMHMEKQSVQNLIHRAMNKLRQYL